MTETECVAFLQWACPRLGLRWRGFKNVRRQVCRRIVARLAALDLDAAGYQARVVQDPTERALLDSLCYVTISRFYRDRRIMDDLASVHLPRIVDRSGRLAIWSAGCASGEEPYTLALIAELTPRLSDRDVGILATDFDPVVLARAGAGIYEEGSLRELPEGWCERGFERVSAGFRVRDEVRRRVELRQEDIRTFVPSAPLQVVACRNLAFTYFAEDVQRDFLARVTTRLVPGGLLVLGAHERLPDEGAERFAPTETPHVFRLVDSR